MKFTKEIKDKWLVALKSGDYKQGKSTLIIDEYTDHFTKYSNNYDGKTQHCCIGVLGEIHPKLSNKKEKEFLITLNDTSNKSPYNFLKDTVGVILCEHLYKLNDEKFNPDKPDYSNVIPFIEKLPTND